MTIQEFENIENELRSLADTQDDVVLEKSGEFVIVRFGTTIQGRIYEDRDSDSIMIKYGESVLSYDEFISKETIRKKRAAQKFKGIKRDLASFADSDNGVDFDYNSGRFSFDRLMGNTTISGRIYIDDQDCVKVEYKGTIMSYNVFLSKELAQLDVFANRLIEKYKEDEQCYIDPQASLCDRAQIKRTEDYALKLLDKEINEDKRLIGTKFCFITADAGHGKSMLLRQFQYQQAQLYLNNQSNYIFLHIDLHGRTLVLLDEAISKALGELRMSGIFYTTILTLLRNRLLVLAIDGFDELAVEKGGDQALNSLSNLVKQMEGEGTLIAAARRAFFDTQEYLKRTGILRSDIYATCICNEIKIHNWTQEQCSKFLSKYNFEEKEYSRLLDILNDKKHPLLERPYLFAKMVTMAKDAKITPCEFISKGGNNKLESINNVIEQFIHREVDKWSYPELDTWCPYMVFDQHIRFLSEIALYMWENQTDKVSIDVLQFYITVLCEEWHIAEDRKPQMFKMVQFHAMLINDGDIYRKFDHEEFKCFFLSKAIEAMIKKYMKEKTQTSNDNLYRMLSLAELPDSVGQYILSQFEEEDVLLVYNCLLQFKKDWRPSYLHSNIGTLLPFLLDKYHPENTLLVNGKIIFSSLVFENKSLDNIIFEDCDFVNISLKNSHFKNINVTNCSFSKIVIWDNSDNIFENFSIDKNCRIAELVITDYNDEEESITEYYPEIIFQKLSQLGFNINNDNEPKDTDEDMYVECDTEFYKMTKRLLYKFNKTTCLYESNLFEYNMLKCRKPEVLKDIINLLVEYEIIEEKENNQTRQAQTKALTLKKYDIQEVFKAEGNPQSPLFSFWQEVKNR